MYAHGYECSFNVLVNEYEYPVEDRTNKPKPLKKKAFESDGSVTWTAAMTITFILNATLILSPHVDTSDPIIKCFFMHCFYFSFAWHKHTWTWDDIVYLDHLIVEHHTLFASLWPNHTIPKFHWILHMAMDIWRCGPVRHITCMRCEAKHQYFKHLTSQLNWLGNVPFTMAKRHSRHSALQFYLARQKPQGRSGVVAVGPMVYFTVTTQHMCGIPLVLLQLGAVEERIRILTGDIAVVQHTKWRYCNQVVQSGTCVLFKTTGGHVRVALIEQLFEITGLFVVTIRPFASDMEMHDTQMVLTDDDMEREEIAMEMNTHHMTIAHRVNVGGKWHILNV